MRYGPLPLSVHRRAAPLLFALFGFSFLLMGPALCFAGVLEHPCSGCPESLSCAHEEGCSDDPCADATVPSRGTQEEASLGLASAAMHAPFLFDDDMHVISRLTLNETDLAPSLLPTGSILPLRI